MCTKIGAGDRCLNKAAQPAASLSSAATDSPQKQKQKKKQKEKAKERERDKDGEAEEASGDEEEIDRGEGRDGLNPRVRAVGVLP